MTDRLGIATGRFTQPGWSLIRPHFDDSRMIEAAGGGDVEAQRGDGLV